MPSKPPRKPPPQDMDHYVPHAGSSLSAGVLAAVRSGGLVGEAGAHAVVAVDGQVVRDLVDIDFTTGGNDARYRYVPPGEVWVERFLPPSDMAPVVLHELIEGAIMRGEVSGPPFGGRRIGYDAAHEAANRAERPIRAALSDGRIAVRDYAEVALSAQRWLTAWLEARWWDEHEKLEKAKSKSRRRP
jgi:hypothetical protein